MVRVQLEHFVFNLPGFHNMKLNWLYHCSHVSCSYISFKDLLNCMSTQSSEPRSQLFKIKAVIQLDKKHCRNKINDMLFSLKTNFQTGSDSVNSTTPLNLIVSPIW